MPDDPADAFATLYDLVDEEVFLARVQAWRRLPATEIIATEVERSLRAGGFSMDGALQGMAAWPVHAQHICFAQLLGLNRFLRDANPYMTDVPPPELAALALRCEISGRLSTENIEGAVLPRVPETADAGPPQEVGDAFDAVIRVPPGQWDARDHAVLPPRLRFTASEREIVRIAAAPMMEDPDEIAWVVDERDGTPVYRVSLKDLPSTRERINVLVAAFSASGAQIAVLPELAASPELLSCWQEALRSRTKSSHDELRWVFVGTGDLDASDPPVNQGALLDAATGDVIATQRKRYRFDFTLEQLSKWKLPLSPPPGSEKLYEDMQPGRGITIVETGLGRLAVLVCEDLARIPTLGLRLRSYGVSHLIAPVFSKPTVEHYWEHSAAKPYAQNIGATVIVVNSLVVGRLQGKLGQLGAALITTPHGTVSAAAGAAEDVMLFELQLGKKPRVV